MPSKTALGDGVEGSVHVGEVFVKPSRQGKAVDGAVAARVAALAPGVEGEFLHYFALVVGDGEEAA